MFTKIGRAKNKLLAGSAILLSGLGGFLIYGQFNNQPDTVGLNYLEKLLAEQQWKEADLETKNVLLRAVGKKGSLEPNTKDFSPGTAPPKYDDYSDLNKVDIEYLKCPILRKIDQLWVKYSKGSFGFSVQRRIEREVAATATDSNNITDEFGRRLGWIQITPQQNITNYFNEVPVGYLPRIFSSYDVRYDEMTSGYYIINRLTECEYANL
jgi:hypothetical protein